MNKKFNLCKTADYIIILAYVFFVALLPFGFSDILRISLYFYAFAIVFDYVVYKRWKQIVFNRESIAYLLMILFFLLNPIHQLFDIPATSYYYWQNEIRISFLIFGLLGILGTTNRVKPYHVAFPMVVISCCIFIYLLIKTAFEWNGVENIWSLFNGIRRSDINSHMMLNLYLNMTIILSLCSFGMLNYKWLRVFFAVGISVCILFVLLSDGRIGMVSCLLVLFFYSLYRTYIKGYYKMIIGVFAVFVCVVGLQVYFNPRISKDIISSDARWQLWEYSYDLSKEHLFIGYGTSTMGKVFVEKAFENEKINNNYIHGVLECPEFKNLPRDNKIIHPHSIFFQILLEHGLIGLLLMILMFVAIACMRVKQNKIYLWLILFVIVVQGCFEHFGSHFYPLMYCWTFLLLDYSTREIEKKDNYLSEIFPSNHPL